MAYYYPTQEDINSLSQRIRNPIVNIYILDFNLKTMGVVSGSLLSEDLSIDVNSDIRKTASISIAVKNNTVDLGENRNFWLNRLVKIEYEIYSEPTHKSLKYNRGIYVLSDYNLLFSSTQYSLSIKLNDLVSLYNGDISGSLGEYGATITKLLASECKTVRDAMLAVCEKANITNYKIGEAKKDFPYDLEFSHSQTIWDMVVAVRDLYPGWEAFFDIDGTFVFQEIPTCENDSIVLDASVLKNIVIEESTSIDIFNVKNVTKVWGKCIESDYFAESVTCSNGIYTATFLSLPIATDGTLSYGIKLAIPIDVTNSKSPKIVIKNTVNEKTTTIGTFDIVNDNEDTIAENVLEAGCTYVFRYKRRLCFLMGQWQIVATCILVASEPTEEEKNRDYEIKGTKNIVYTVNPESPFCREYIGERIQSLTGGDCDDIDSELKVKERAEYENWRSARIAYTTTLNCLYVPFLYGNEKIGYDLKSTGEIKEWIVKRISGSWINQEMTLTLAEFYPLYPFIVSDGKGSE